ncbi:MAG: hypothetical protein KIT80_21940 [Chitinophagaceae bacterium]|nr:hypothetical protein [Chitinophagaceae bacterium]MCW5929598.1 hypothetical protein [Chitinophagaceae bacterium]
MQPLSRATPYFDGGLMGRAAGPNDYQPYGEGGFIKKNGSSEGKYVITTGVWKLSVGDKPIIRLALRDTGSAYAKPAILPHLGVNGKIRLELISGKSKKYLDEFSSITAMLLAGEPQWICEDRQMNLKVTLTAHAFVEEYGCALTAQVEAAAEKKVQLNWYYEDAAFVRDSAFFSEFEYDKYTRIFTGSTSSKAVYQKGVTQTILAGAGKSKPVADTLICVWGYSNYDHEAVDNAIKRLRFRPFPSEAWAAHMQKKWFHHWIERGLEPEKKFATIVNNAALPISQSKQYWAAMRNRVKVNTGDTRFDNIVQSLGARLISNYEYPAYMHGSNYMKYGKINCGLYGHEAAGFHEEVASTLRFISGTQDVKGRQRYFEPAFTISTWAEEINPYFIDQVWYHYRWTGDKDFLVEMWPAVRRALEHFIATSDPQHNGFFTGYYENWNGDGKSRGGTGALWTAMAIKALRAGYEIATLLEDVDWQRETFQVTDNPSKDGDFRERYKRLLQKAEAAYETRYNKKIGAYSSGDWDAALRNMPGNEESNYAIWREVGDPLKNYTSMRFIRDEYHQPTPNGVVEYSNKDWPVCWSNHYDSYAEAMSSIASAAMTNDMNHYWPLLKTAAEKIYTVPECTAIAGGRSILSLESDQMFMMAVLDNVFGIKPYFGENLLVIRPSFPESWKNPSIELPDVSYRYVTGNDEITLLVNTPVGRILQAEIPVRQEIKEITINGQSTHFETRKEVNYCRVIVRSEAASSHEIKIRLYPDDFSVTGHANGIVDQTDSFRIRNAEIIQVVCPQDSVGMLSVKDGMIQITPHIAGRFTLFAELKKGNVSWFHPIELTVREPWIIQTEYHAWEEADNGKSKPAKLLSPSVDIRKKVLRFRLTNNTAVQQSGDMRVAINGRSFVQRVALAPHGSGSFEIPLGNIWAGLSRGSLFFTVTFMNEVKTSHAIHWQLPGMNVSGKTIIPLDISNYYNINLAQLYGRDSFKWRIDYTGAAVGVDWRDTLYTDRLGYKLFSAPTSVISYGVLPEQMSPSWWSVPSIPDTLAYPVPFSFIEHTTGKNNVLALVNAENNQHIPSQAVIHLKEPVLAEKIYMLTANLTKTSKSYYPAAEIEIVYERGENQVVQLIPPYNMPSMIQAFCPDAFPVPLGEIKKKQTMDFDAPGLSVTDLVTDPTRKIREIVFRCVASETAVGLIAISLLPGTTALQAVH